MSDTVTVDVDRLAALERLEAAARGWLAGWEAAQRITAPTDKATARAFEGSQALAAAVRSTPSR